MTGVLTVLIAGRSTAGAPSSNARSTDRVPVLRAQVAGGMLKVVLYLVDGGGETRDAPIGVVISREPIVLRSATLLFNDDVNPMVA